MKAIIACLFLLISVSYADTYDEENNNNTIKELYCPKITDLKQTNMKWHAETIVKWNEAEESFVTQITSFKGAQWQGIKVGQISCIYKGADSNTFPVVLQNNHMFKQPQHQNWIKSDNTYNCLDGQVENCPLYPYMGKKAPSNLYDMLDSLKN
jgi:hypothetical protein